MNERDMLTTITTLDPESDALRRTLSWHLSCNHYPSVPTSMIEPCVAAIEACNDDEHDRLIDLPDGITWRGKHQAPAWAIVEGHHLSDFLDYDDMADDA